MNLNATEMTPAEWEVMRIIWTKGDVGSNDIIAAVRNKRDWSESTIKTLLRRLVKKEMLTTVATGHRFTYHPAISEQVAMAQTTTHLFASLCAMKKGAALVHLIEETPLSRADIETMQQVLAQKLTTAPESVPCDCLAGTDDCCD